MNSTTFTQWAMGERKMGERPKRYAPFPLKSSQTSSDSEGR